VSDSWRFRVRWPRAVALVDMNAFFASIEQLDFPELRGRPVAVVNGSLGTCIITCSYEARRHGVRTGMRLREARTLCPGLVARSARPERYAAISTRIMDLLGSITPDLEVFSVDEAFLDLTRCQGLGTPVALARRAQELVVRETGLPCSVGLSGDKTTAKYAAKLKKPSGFVVIPPWEARARLRDVPVTELCGIKDGIGSFLAARGVRTCGDMERLPPSALTRRFGPPGLRYWLMAQGADPDPVRPSDPRPPRTLGHGKVTPPGTTDRALLRTYFLHMVEKLAARLRANGLEAQTYRFAAYGREGACEAVHRTAVATDDPAVLRPYTEVFLREVWDGRGIMRIHVLALDPRPLGRQPDLWDAPDPRRARLNAAVDAVNRRFGPWTLLPAALLERSSSPDVIAPAWRPSGVRKSV
jgi:DNA polymerase-4